MKFYLPGLDGLRGLAFLAVFIGHACYSAGAPIAPAKALGPDNVDWWFRGLAHAGTFGVDLFFVLSGFLITRLLLQEEATRGRINIGAFWIRRALRIWPAYYALLACTLVFNETSRGAIAALATFTGNLRHSMRPFSLGPVDVGILWSIQIEEQFYLLWPLMLTVVPRHYRLLLGPVLVAVSIVSRLWLFSGGASLVVWTFTPARLDGLGVGIVLAFLPLSTAPWFVKRLSLALPVVAVVAAGFTSQALRVGDPALSIRPEWIMGAVGIPTVIALFCGIVLWAAPSSRWLCWWPLVHLGRISYGLYLIHFTVIGWFSSLWWPWSFVLSLAVSVLLAEASYRFLERPFLRLKERFTPASEEASSNAKDAFGITAAVPHR